MSFNYTTFTLFNFILIHLCFQIKREILPNTIETYFLLTVHLEHN